MIFACADPPYLGCCSYYKHEHNDAGTRPFDGHCWNDIATHRVLVDWLRASYPDGFGMSMSSPTLLRLNLQDPDDLRVGSWNKPFSSHKPGINPGYCWEPVLFRGGELEHATRTPCVTT